MGPPSGTAVPERDYCGVSEATRQAADRRRASAEDYGATSWRIAALFFGVGTLSRLPFLTANLWAHDSVLYARAIEHFDPLDQRPQAPGYLYYVVLLRALNAVTGDPNRAMTIVSLVAGAAAVALLYLLAARMYDERTARASAAFLLTSVTFWAESVVAYPYTLLAALSIGCAILFWRALATPERRGPRLAIASAAYGIAVGFRTDLAIFLAPLWLLAAWGAPLRWSAAGAALVSALVAVWFSATAALGGGVAALLAALGEQGRFIDERYSVFGNGPRAIVTNAYELARYLGRAMYFLIPAAVVPVLSSDARRIELRDRRRAAFVLLWTFTPLLIYIPIHVGEYGYVFSMLPGICVIAARGVIAFARGARIPRLFPWLVAGVAIANAGVFLVSDTPLSARDLARRDRGLDEKLARLAEPDLAHATIITGFDSLVVEYYLIEKPRLRNASYYPYDPSGSPRVLNVPGISVCPPGYDPRTGPSGCSTVDSIVVVWDDLLRVSGRGWEEITLPHGAKLRVARGTAGARLTMQGLSVELSR